MHLIMCIKRGSSLSLLSIELIVFVLLFISHLIFNFLDSTRPSRRLWTENGKGSRVSLIKFSTSEDEAVFVVSEIVRLINASKGLLEFSNFAVLVRTTMLSRVLEQTFTFHSIPYTMVGELRYFESVEIKDLLAYLHLIQNPDNNGTVYINSLEFLTFKFNL